jgi:hypothetical protein
MPLDIDTAKLPTIGAAPLSSGPLDIDKANLPVLGAAHPRHNKRDIDTAGLDEKEDFSGNPWAHLNKLTPAQRALLPITDLPRQFVENATAGEHEAMDAAKKIWNDRTYGGKALGVLELAGGVWDTVASPVTAGIQDIVANPLSAGYSSAKSALGYGEDTGEDIVNRGRNITTIASALIPLNPAKVLLAPREIVAGLKAGKGWVQMMAESPFSPAGVKVVAGVSKIARKLSMVRQAIGIRALLAPGGLDVEAGQAAGHVRAALGEYYKRTEQLTAKLEQYSTAFDKMDQTDSYNFIHAMEAGTKQASPELDDTAQVLRGLLDGRRDEVVGLGAGNMVHWIENYFPHIWEHDDQFEQKLNSILNNKTVLGSRAFQKERKLPTFADGLNAGLKPVTDNPVKLAQLKLAEMDRFITGKKLIKQLYADRLIRPSIQFGPEAHVLSGAFQKLDDPAFRIFGEVTDKFTEGFDKQLRDGLLQMAKDHGFTHQRALELGATDVFKGRNPKERTWGAAIEQSPRTGKPSMATKFGGPDFVIAHELGHLLDFKYQLSSKFMANKDVWKQLEALAVQRSPGAVDASTAYGRYVRQSTERIANLIHAYVYAPELLERVAPDAKKMLEGIIQKEPGMAALGKIRPGVELATNSIEKSFGVFPHGEYKALPSVARVLNNTFGAMSQMAKDSPLSMIRNFANLMTMSQLSLSAFHLTFTSLDAINSRTALALERFAHKEIAGGVGALLSAPFAPITSFMKGSALRKAYLNPEGKTPGVQALVEAVSMAGGRIGGGREHSVTDQGSLWKSLVNKGLGGTLKEIGDTFKGPWGIPKGAFNLFGRAIESSSAWLMNGIVPRQKLGVFYDLAQDFIRRHPEAKPADIQKAMQLVWNSVDNRMGLMVYDNLMWHNSVRNLSHIAFRSVGWNLGTIREVGGGIKDAFVQTEHMEAGDVAKLTHRMAYTAAMVVNTGLIGTALTYYYTGNGPKEAIDYFFPPTGKIDRKTGKQERIALPTYVKDLEEYSVAPWQTALNKLNPIWPTVQQVLTNTDFRGGAIGDPRDLKHDHAMKYFMERFPGYFLSQMEPFSFRTDTDRRLNVPGGGPLQFFGVQKAPQAIAAPERNEKFEKKQEKKAIKIRRREQMQERQRERANG